MFIWVIVSYAFLASAITANKFLLGTVAPSIVVCARMLGAGIILMGYLLVRRSEQLHWRYLRNDWPALLKIIFFTTIIPSLLKAYALQHMISAKAALLGSLDPFITAFYAYNMHGHTVRAVQWFGMLLGFIGVLLVIVAPASAEESVVLWGVVSWPEIAALSAHAIGRYGWMLIQKLLHQHRYGPVELMAISMFSSGCVLGGALGIASLWDQNIGISVARLLEPYNGLIALYTILGGNVIGYTLYTSTLRHHSATLVSLTGFTIPLFVGIFGYIILGEPIVLSMVLAAILMFVGLTIFYRNELKGLLVVTHKS